MTAVRWPEGFDPADATLYVVNEGTSTAPPEDIWRWLVRPDHWGDYYSNVSRVRAKEGAWPEIENGSTFTWVTFNAPVTTTVDEFVPFERLAWTGSGLGSVGHHAWLLEADGRGGTRIVTEEVQRGAAVRLFRPVLRRRMQALHQQWVDNLATIAESGARP
jgi:uncharacterized protein YndB with AHSA1/START domain